MKHLNVAITSLELALEEVRQKDEAEEIALQLDKAKRLLDDNNFSEADTILDLIGKRINYLCGDLS